ncbi:MAG: hypothetical protein ACR2NF_11040 [Pirellulales bacterium]
MIQLIQDNLMNIVLIVGAAAILFLPQIKAGLALLKEQGGQEAPSNSDQKVSSCACCCPTEPVHDDAPKSEWVIRTMEIRSYCLDHRLSDGVKLCEELVTVLVSGKPEKPEIDKAVVMVRKETR